MDKTTALIKAMKDLKESRAAAKTLRDQNLGNSVTGYGVLIASNPSDQTVDGWTEKQLADFTSACNN